MTIATFVLSSYSHADVLVFSRNGAFVSMPNLATAATAVDAAGQTVVVTSPQTVATPIVWPSDRILTFSKGGSIMFAGSGALTGLHEARPEWFGAKGDGINDDTAAINNVVASVQGGVIKFAPGIYNYAGGATLYDGTTIIGAGRNATTIRASYVNGFLFKAAGYGSGLKSLRFDSSVTQYGGSYVVLSGPESFIEDFFMTGDYNGILMTGSVSRIRHGRFQDGASGAIRIRAEGGDTSQLIDDVLMGAQTPANISYAGIRIRNSAALIISNTSVLQQGVGLLIDPTTSTDSVFSTYVHHCFFDNNTHAIQISPTGAASVARIKFDNVWAGSSSSEGIIINNTGTGIVSGIHFESIQAVLNARSGLTTGGTISDLSISGGQFSQNMFGLYFNSGVTNLKIQGATVGIGAGMQGNSSYGIVISTGVTNFSIVGNNLLGNNSGSLVDNSGSTDRFISNNFGYISKT